MIFFSLLWFTNIIMLIDYVLLKPSFYSLTRTHLIQDIFFNVKFLLRNLLIIRGFYCNLWGESLLLFFLFNPHPEDIPFIDFLEREWEGGRRRGGRGRETSAWERHIDCLPPALTLARGRGLYLQPRYIPLGIKQETLQCVGQYCNHWANYPFLFLKSMGFGISVMFVLKYGGFSLSEAI